MRVAVGLVGGGDSPPPGSWLCMLSSAGWLPSTGSAPFLNTQRVWDLPTFKNSLPVAICQQHLLLADSHVWPVVSNDMKLYNFKSAPAMSQLQVIVNGWISSYNIADVMHCLGMDASCCNSVEHRLYSSLFIGQQFQLYSARVCNILLCTV